MSPEPQPALFPISWVDKFLERIERAPLSSFIIYSLIYGLSVLFILSLRVLDGHANWLSINTEEIIAGIWIILPLRALYYINKEAGKAVDKLRPALQMKAIELDAIRFRMTHTPQPSILILHILMILLLAIPSLSNPGFLMPYFRSKLISLVLAIYIGTAFALFALFITQVAAQLIGGTHLLKKVNRINIFDLHTLYALSSLTSKIVIVVVVLSNIPMIANVWLNVGVQIITPKIALIIISAEAIIALLVFFVPLWDIHLLLVDKKEAVLVKIAAS